MNRYALARQQQTKPESSSESVSYEETSSSSSYEEVVVRQKKIKPTPSVGPQTEAKPPKKTTGKGKSGALAQRRTITNIPHPNMGEASMKEKKVSKKESKIQEDEQTKKTFENKHNTSGTKFVYKNLSDSEKEKIISCFNKVSGNRQEKIAQVNEKTGYSKYMITKVIQNNK